MVSLCFADDHVPLENCFSLHGKLVLLTFDMHFQNCLGFKLTANLLVVLVTVRVL